MKNRSLSKLALLSFFTLGFYELVWLSQTRNEMVSKFGQKIPSIRRVVLIEGFEIVCILVFLASLLLLIPFLNNKISTAPDNPLPSSQCQYDYAAGHSVTNACRMSVDTYYGTTSPKERYSNYLAYSLVAMIAVSLVAILSAFGIVKWFEPYAAGVAAVTNGQISKKRAYNYLTLLPPTMTMMRLQAAYNGVVPIRSD